MLMSEFSDIAIERSIPGPSSAEVLRLSDNKISNKMTSSKKTINRDMISLDSGKWNENIQLCQLKNYLDQQTSGG